MQKKSECPSICALKLLAKVRELEQRYRDGRDYSVEELEAAIREDDQ